MSYRILILGASYGSLLATKLALGGHDVTLVCLPVEADLINAEGTRVRLPIKGRADLVEINSRTAKGKIDAEVPAKADPAKYDLVVLAMQEPQYRAPEIRALLDRATAARVPCMSIMNMPPLPYLRRLPGLDADRLTHCYADAAVWNSFDPNLITLCSPDPQAFRPPEEGPNVLQVTLPTNFKAAAMASEKDTAMLRRLQADVDAVRYPVPEGEIELPVKFKVHDSLFVPLAKWSMLLTGNYRCIQAEGPRSIRDAVHSDLAESQRVYEWVGKVCTKLGASADDLVPFEKYANAAKGLLKPSSAARALFAGAPYIERVDLLVQSIAAQLGMSEPVVDEIVEIVNGQLALNRKAAA